MAQRLRDGHYPTRQSDSTPTPVWAECGSNWLGSLYREGGGDYSWVTALLATQHRILIYICMYYLEYNTVVVVC